jgi:hypothetical protein
VPALLTTSQKYLNTQGMGRKNPLAR